MLNIHLIHYSHGSADPGNGKKPRWRTREYFKQTTDKIIRTREWTKEELKKLGFLFEDSKSNFVFVTHPKVSAKQLFENLKKENVYVRYFAKPERISNYLRITIGTDEEMQKLLSLLKKYC